MREMLSTSLLKHGESRKDSRLYTQFLVYSKGKRDLMKQIDPKENRIVFFSTLPLEEETEIHEATLQSARALALKKHNRVFVYTSKQKNSQKAEVLESIKIELGKASYRHYSLRQLFSRLKDANQIMIDNKPRTLLFVSLLVLLRRAKRKHILVQCLIPLHIDHAKSLRDRIHNIRYASPIYRVLIYTAGAHHQVLNSQDKRRIRKASLIRPPVNETFLKAPKANKSVGKKRTIIIAGPLNYKQGSDMLPLLFKELQRKKLLDQMKFIILGDGEMRELVEKTSKKYKNVKYIREAKRITDIYSKGNIFLLLARHQASLYSLADAMAIGLIPIAFRIPNLYSKRLKEIIHYVDTLDVKDVVKTLKLLIKANAEEIKTEGEKVSQFAERNYTIEGYVKKLTLLFNPDKESNPE